ncbi:21265_t:CDS:2 [Cetraspora pellucida]|uniref:21265_t:CDS:1 n=1 Tax=Cetraspora pellucida TaxID=1433469 RepID=A0A9N9NR09_9GLOM|nr:21265_t:CDS:2 [Cetraspora pellucida]
MTDDLVEDNPALRKQYLTETEWYEVEAIVILLEPIAKATLILSLLTCPMMRDLYMIFPTILNILYNALNSKIQINSQIAQRIYKKLNDYWSVLRTCCSVLVALDPNIKLSSFDSKTAIIVHELLYSIYKQYKEPSSSVTEDTNDSPRNYFRKHRNESLPTNSNVLMNTLQPLKKIVTLWNSEKHDLLICIILGFQE